VAVDKAQANIGGILLRFIETHGIEQRKVNGPVPAFERFSLFRFLTCPDSWHKEHNHKEGSDQLLPHDHLPGMDFKDKSFFLLYEKTRSKVQPVRRPPLSDRGNERSFLLRSRFDFVFMRIYIRYA